MVTAINPSISAQRDTAQLPLEEFVQSRVLLAVGITALNDHLLKTSDILPSIITGKLSDFAGLIFFPLFLTAFVNTVLYFVARTLSGLGIHRTVPYPLTQKKLLWSCILTGAGFSALQLLCPAKEVYVAVHQFIGITVHVTQDPTDLIALFALPIAYQLGRPFAR